MSKLAKRRAKAASKSLIPKFIRNPPFGKDLVEQVGPGVAAYGGTKLFQRLAMAIIAKRWPKLVKHAGVLSSGAAFAILWYISSRWKKLERYSGPILVGSGVAVVQSAARYIPKLHFLVSDPDPADYVGRLPVNATPVFPQEIDDGTDLVDEFEPQGGYIDVPARGIEAPASGGPQSMEDAVGDLDPDDLGSLTGGEDLETDNVFDN